jgi:hypothetical protein
MAITKGNLVVFRKGLYEDEEGAIYRVLETNGDRGILELVNTNMVIRPQTVAILSELDLFDQDTSGNITSLFQSK